MTRTPEGMTFDWGKVHGGLLRVKSSKDEPKGEMIKGQKTDLWWYDGPRPNGVTLDPGSQGWD
jgi:hypothetical protein